MKVSMCTLGVRSLPSRPWPMAEVRKREPVAHVVDRLAAPLADALEKALRRWEPSHQLAGHAQEAAIAEVWASVYAMLSCPPQLQPMNRQQILEQVSDLARRKPPPQNLTAAEQNAAVLSIFTFSEIELLSLRFFLEHNDSSLAEASTKPRLGVMESGIQYLDPKLVLNVERRGPILNDLAVFGDAYMEVLQDQRMSLLSTVTYSDIAFLPPTVRTPTNPKDLSTWWVQVPGQPMPITVDSLPQTQCHLA
jgi:hypothetical protein